MKKALWMIAIAAGIAYVANKAMASVQAQMEAKQRQLAQYNQ